MLVHCYSALVNDISRSAPADSLSTSVVMDEVKFDYDDISILEESLRCESESIFSTGGASDEARRDFTRSRSEISLKESRLEEIWRTPRPMGGMKFYSLLSS